MSLSNPINPPLVNEAVAKPASSGLVFAVDENQTKVNQIHGINPAGSTGAGIPKPVTNVRASIANASLGSTSTVSVLFQRNPTDNNFAGVKIYAKGYQGNNTPVQVGGGQDSPTTVILNNTGESVTLIVQSVGNGGVSPIASSPTYGIKLPKNSNGGVGTQTTTNLTLGQIPSNQTSSATLFISSFAIPWLLAKNPSFSISPVGSTPPVVAPIVVVPGFTITVSYVKGGVILSPGQPVTTDLQGDPNASGTGSSSGVFFPAHYVTGSSLKICGLVGAFTDDNGVIVSLFDLSAGSSFVVPVGATKVQFGVNDVFYADNSGPGYTITVKSSVSNTSTSGNTIAQSARKTFIASSNGNDEWLSGTAAQPLGDFITRVTGTNTPVFVANQAPTATSGTGTFVFNTTSNVYAGWRGQTIWRTGRTIDGQFQIAPYLVTGTGFRFLFGFFDSTAPASSDTGISTNYACFRGSSIAGDTNWKAIVSNNNGVSQTVVDTGVAITINASNDQIEHMHRFGIRFDDANSRILFYIDGTLVATITTNTPTTNTNMCWGVLGAYITTNNGFLLGVGQVMVAADM